MLRADSEASNLIFSTNSAPESDLFSPLPVGVEVVVFVDRDRLVVRLAKRKAHPFGDCVFRVCTCSKAEGVSLYVPSELCPVHVLGGWLASNVAPGGRVFPPGFAKEALEWLRIALAARDVPNAFNYGLHSLRRGAARELTACGGDLATLLRAGGWKSNAFSAYLDMVGLESKVFHASINALVDLDQGME